MYFPSGCLCLLPIPFLSPSSAAPIVIYIVSPSRSCLPAHSSGLLRSAATLFSTLRQSRKVKNPKRKYIHLLVLLFQFQRRRFPSSWHINRDGTRARRSEATGHGALPWGSCRCCCRCCCQFVPQSRLKH